mmetsp:Transcript_24300/g.72592  ORF Transcript_24300/g.72592 Transcript_24300/m.72592 type:complete len:232 (-) Transcript_24300:3832-4527(-)
MFAIRLYFLPSSSSRGSSNSTVYEISPSSFVASSCTPFVKIVFEWPPKPLPSLLSSAHSTVARYRRPPSPKSLTPSKTIGESTLTQIASALPDTFQLWVLPPRGKRRASLGGGAEAFIIELPGPEVTIADNDMRDRPTVDTFVGMSARLGMEAAATVAAQEPEPMTQCRRTRPILGLKDHKFLNVGSKHVTSGSVPSTSSSVQKALSVSGNVADWRVGTSGRAEYPRTDRL